jgi:hypothetical protein
MNGASVLVSVPPRAAPADGRGVKQQEVIMRDVNVERLSEWELSDLFRAVALDLARIEEDRRGVLAALRKIQRARQARTRKTSRAGPKGPA